VHQVDAGAGAVIFAHGVDRFRLGGAAHVFGHRLRWEDLGGIGPAFEAPADELVGCGPDHPLGEVVGLDQEEPVVGVGRHLFVDDLEHPVGWDDIQQSQFPYPLRVVLGQAVGNPGAPVVGDQKERIEPQLFHDLNLVLGHGALGVVQMFRVALRFAAIAVTPEVRRDHGEVPCQKGGYFVPHGVGLRVSVKQ